jgi:hypothetical protein
MSNFDRNFRSTGRAITGILLAQGCAFLLVVIGIVALCVVGIIGWSNGGWVVSDGHREGYIQKFSHKGVVWHTWEGELSMKGWKAAGSNGASSSVFEFSVLDPDVVKEIDGLHEADEVRLYYKEYLMSPPWRGATGHFITRVEKVAQPPEGK